MDEAVQRFRQQARRELGADATGREAPRSA